MENQDDIHSFECDDCEKKQQIITVKHAMVIYARTAK